MKTLRACFFISLLLIGAAVLAQSKDASTPHVDLISIDGSINPAVDDFIRKNVRPKTKTAPSATDLQLTRGGCDSIAQS